MQRQLARAHVPCQDHATESLDPASLDTLASVTKAWTQIVVCVDRSSADRRVRLHTSELVRCARYRLTKPSRRSYKPWLGLATEKESASASGSGLAPSERRKAVSDFLGGHQQRSSREEEPDDRSGRAY